MPGAVLGPGSTGDQAARSPVPGECAWGERGKELQFTKPNGLIPYIRESHVLETNKAGERRGGGGVVNRVVRAGLAEKGET